MLCYCIAGIEINLKFMEYFVFGVLQEFFDRILAEYKRIMALCCVAIFMYNASTLLEFVNQGQLKAIIESP